MFSSIETCLICIFVAVLSIVEVLSARFYLRDFPWQELIFSTRFFGGKSYLLQRLLMLSCWLALSIAITLLFAALLKACIFLFADASNASFHPNFHSVMAALPTILSVAFYVGLCQLIRARVIRQQEHTDFTGLTEPVELNLEKFVGKLISFGAAPSAVVRTPFAFLSKPFLMLYRYFYLDAGRLLNGASGALVNQYGPEAIVRFFENHQNADSHRAGNLRLNHLDGHYESSLDWAQYLLTANIRYKGLWQIKKAIKRYVDSRKCAAASKRGAERIRCINPIRVMIRSKGLVGYAKLLEYSEGYRGFYITTNLNIDHSERINITINDTEYTTKVVHQNCFIAKERIFSGYGLSLAS